MIAAHLTAASAPAVAATIALVLLVAGQELLRRRR